MLQAFEDTAGLWVVWQLLSIVNRLRSMQAPIDN
jgi:hypothetical protein